MPVKYKILVGLFWFLGLGLTGIFLWNCAKALRSWRVVRILKALTILISFAAVSLSLAYVYIPQFNPFRPVLFRASGGEKRLVLTFDDGPNEPFTSQILSILKERQVPATFFLIGENAARYPDAVHRIQADGHEIGNHTFDHHTLVGFSESEILSEIEGWEKVMGEMGVKSDLFRAPHGWKVPWLYTILDKKNYRLVAWTRGVWDTDPVGEEILFQRLTQGVKPGEILLLHDGVDTREHPDRSQLVKVLPRVLDYYREQGFEIIPLRLLIEETPERI